jgi:hypothetical protein
MFFAVLLVVLALFVLRLLGGYPQSKVVTARLSRGEVAFLEAAAGALAPPVEGALARAGAEAELPSFIDEYLTALPRRQARLIRLLLVSFEHATLVFPARGQGGFSRFSKLSSAQREALLREWESSRLAVRRTLFTALKALLVMGIVAHRDNLAHLGLTPWDIGSPVIESDLLYPPVGQPSSAIVFGEDDLSPVRDASPLRPQRGSP